MKLQEGQSRYTPDPGVVPEGEKVYCGVCGDEMKEERNVLGPRGWAAAISRHYTLHDVFTCTQASTDWHRQVVALRAEAKKTSSRKLTLLLLEEAEQVLKDRLATKKVSDYQCI